MSLQNDINMVKEKLTSEEKFFEKAVMTEKFVKKYKNLMIGLGVAVVVFVVGSLTYSAIQESRIADANIALLELQSKESSPATLARLESLSPELHDVWLYSEAVVKQNTSELEKLQKSKAPLVGDLSAYAVASANKDAEKLESYTKKQNALYRDLAILQAAVILMHEKKIDKAHTKLKAISIESPLAETATALMHYGVK